MFGPKKKKFMLELFSDYDRVSNILPFGKIITQTAIICLIIPLMPMVIDSIPFIKAIIDTIGIATPDPVIFSDIIHRLLSISISYMILNIVNSFSANKTCTDNYSSKNAAVILLISIIGNIIIKQ